MRAMDVMFDERDVVEDAARRWWIFLLIGIAWLVFALLFFQWDYTTVYAVSFLFGVVALFAGVNEFVQIAVSTTGWKIVHGILGVLFVIAGIWALVAPAHRVRDPRCADRLLPPGQGNLRRHGRVHDRGDLRSLVAPAHDRHLRDRARLLGRRLVQASAILLVVYVGIVALSRGITELFLAFKLKGLKKRIAA